MTELLNDQLLTEFFQNFYGYGNYRGQFWFIGMEEGSGNSFSEINTRLSAIAIREKTIGELNAVQLLNKFSMKFL